MKTSLFAIALLSSLALQGQAQLISFEQLDKRKNTEGTPVYYFEETSFTGMTYDYSEEVNVSLEHHLVDGLLTLKEGFRDGQKIEYAEFEEGRLHGTYLKLFGSGQKYVEHHYLQGKMHGQQYGWKRDGQLRFVAEYKNGLELSRINYPPPGGFDTLIKN